MTRWLFLLLFVGVVFPTPSYSFKVDDWINSDNTEILDLSPNGEVVLWRKKAENTQLVLQSIYSDKHLQVNFGEYEKLYDAKFFNQYSVVYLVKTASDTRLVWLDTKTQEQTILFRGKGIGFLVDTGLSSKVISFVLDNQLLNFSVERHLVDTEYKLPQATTQVFTSQDQTPCVALTSASEVYRYHDKSWEPINLETSEHLKVVKAVSSRSCNTFWVQAVESLPTSGFATEKLAQHFKLYQLKFSNSSNEQELKLISRPGNNILGFTMSRERERLAVTYSENVFPKVSIFNRLYANLNSRIRPFGDHPNWRIKAVSDSERQFVIEIETPTIAPSTYYIDLEKNNTFLLDRTIKPLDKSSPKAVKVKSSDSTELTSYLWVDETNSNQQPLLLQLQSKPLLKQSVWRFNPFAAYLQSNAINFATFHYRGFDSKDSRELPYSFQQWGNEMSNDIASVLSYVSNTYQVNSTQVCLYGQSFGAVAVLTELLENGDDYACAIVVNGTYAELMQSEIEENLWADVDDISIPILMITTNDLAKANSDELERKLNTLAPNLTLQFSALDLNIDSIQKAPESFYSTIEDFIKTNLE